MSKVPRLDSGVRAPCGATDIWSLRAFPSVGLGPVAYRMIQARGPDDAIRHQQSCVTKQSKADFHYPNLTYINDVKMGEKSTMSTTLTPYAKPVEISKKPNLGHTILPGDATEELRLVSCKLY
ncbi:hypothetical protein Tco_0591031 [Tanacetum coccineum]